jgi:putative Holliday junction resolvase
MRYLGIDYGMKKVGLALSDENGTMGFPHTIVPTTPELSELLALLIKKEGVGAVVIGESKDFSGADNPVAQYAHRLGDRLTKHTGVPVFYESETLTSAEARRMYEPTEKTRKPSVRADVDASAAALILTSFLSRTNHG